MRGQQPFPPPRVKRYPDTRPHLHPRAGVEADGGSSRGFQQRDREGRSQAPSQNPTLFAQGIRLQSSLQARLCFSTRATAQLHCHGPEGFSQAPPSRLQKTSRPLQDAPMGPWATLARLQPPEKRCFDGPGSPERLVAPPPRVARLSAFSFFISRVSGSGRKVTAAQSCFLERCLVEGRAKIG